MFFNRQGIIKMEKSKGTYSISGFFLKLNQIIWRKSYLQKIRGLYQYIDAILLCFIAKPKRVKEQKKEQVLIVYNLALGDGILFLGAYEALKEIYPDDKYEITITCQKAFAQLYENRFDHVLPLDFSGAVVDLKARFQLFKKLRERYYDIIVDPVGSEDCSTNIWVTRATVGKRKIGVVDNTLEHQCSERLRRSIYTDVVEIDKPGLHLIEYYTAFFKKLKPELNIQAHPAKLPSVNLDFDLPNEYFIVFPAASMEVKRWPTERFAWVTEKIYKESGMPLVLCGTEHDRKKFDDFTKLLDESIPIIDCIGKTNILEFCEVIGRAKLVLTNDTSAYHIAVAQQRLTVLIAGGYTYTRYASYHYSKLGYKDPVLVSHRMPCFDCNNHCKYTDRLVFPCIESITKEQVWNEVKRLICKRKIENEV